MGFLMNDNDINNHPGTECFCHSCNMLAPETNEPVELRKTAAQAIRERYGKAEYDYFTTMPGAKIHHDGVVELPS